MVFSTFSGIDSRRLMNSCFLSLLFFQVINHLLNIRMWIKHNRIQYHTGTDYSASSEEWHTKKSQQGILSQQYDGIYLATTSILYSKSHFCELNITLVFQDLSLQLLWGWGFKGVFISPFNFSWKGKVSSFPPPSCFFQRWSYDLSELPKGAKCLWSW